jgi:hypothetical protein
MEYIISNISVPVLIQDSLALLISFLIGFLIWVIQQSYGEHKQEIGSLKKLEICLSGDLATNKHNQEYLNDWIEKLGKNELFSFVFRSYSLDTSELLHIKNPNLINRINALSFGLNVLFNDLKNIYDLYSSNSFKFLEKDLVENWKEMNTNTLAQLAVPKQNFIDSEKNIKEAVAYLRAYYDQKRFSIYTLFSFFSYNIYPKLTDKNIQGHITNLNKNLEDKVSAREGSK